jgi:hypothetical protein
LLASSPDTENREWRPDYQDWAQSKILGLINKVAPVMFKKLGDISLPVEFTGVVEVMPGKRWAYVIGPLRIKGLSTAHNVQVMQPRDDVNTTYLESHVNFRHLTISLDLSLKPPGEDIVTGTVDLIMSGITVGTEMVAALNMHRLNNLFVEKIVQSACIFSAFDELTFTSVIFNSTIDAISVKLAHQEGIPDDVESLVNNVAKVIIDGYRPLVTAVISGIAQGPFRASLNTAIEAAIAGSNGACPEHESHESSIITWSESSLLSSISKFVDDVIRPEGINNIVNF